MEDMKRTGNGLLLFVGSGTKNGKRVGAMVFSYDSPRWKRKKEMILKRDGYQCRNCLRYGKHTPASVVHHVKHVDEYPELAFTDSNLVSLCQACHNKAHPEKGGRRY